jgi:cyclophilin family peptidyl-prolyl cis-trans isomerase
MRPVLIPALSLTASGLLAGGLLACGDAATPKPPVIPNAPAAARAIPGPSAAPVTSPDRYRAEFTTSKGVFVVEVTRSLAPRAADRFYELVQNGYYERTRFYRVVPGFITQWGIHGDTAVNAQWDTATIPDEPMRTSNVRGRIAFAANGPNSRATEVFIATGDQAKTLDRQRFAPFGSVVQGMDVVERITAEYGEEPNYSRISHQGNSYLRKWFPALDSVVSARIIQP